MADRPERPARRGNARRRDWALCRLDRTLAYRLTFDQRTYRWEVEPAPAGAAPPGGPEAASGSERDGTTEGTAPPAVRLAPTS